MTGPHPSHKTRISLEASSYDEICVNCGAHDEVPGGWGSLVFPCSNPDGKKESGTEKPTNLSLIDRHMMP